MLICGKLFHLEEEETRQVQYLLHLKENFDIDVGRSLFMGVCSGCKQKAEQKEKTIRTDRKGTGTENEMEKGTMCSPIIMFDNVSWMFF